MSGIVLDFCDEQPIHAGKYLFLKNEGGIESTVITENDLKIARKDKGYLSGGKYLQYILKEEKR